MDHSRAAPVPVDKDTAERHKVTLTTVQRLLNRRGIKNLRIQLIRAVLHGPRLSAPPDARGTRVDLYPPKLEVTGPNGRMRAMVRVDQRSDCYLVSVPPDTEPVKVRADRPDQVVTLIVGHTP